MATPEQIKAYFEGDFLPAANLSPELRNANALEYIAFQLGRLNRNLEATKVSVERLASAVPRR